MKPQRPGRSNRTARKAKPTANAARHRRRRRSPRFKVTTLLLFLLPSVATIVWLVDLRFFNLFCNRSDRGQCSLAKILLSLRSDVVLPSMQYAQLKVLDQSDYIYSAEDWDAAPIVVPKYKLIFFTVPKIGCTTWKQLFRRMMGFPDWQMQDLPNIPHNPSKNGLYYLYHFTQTSANYMLTSPNWTRVIFTRDPKERLLSAYLDKALQEKEYIRIHCCPQNDTTQPPKSSKERSVQAKKQHAHPRLITFCHQESTHWTFEAFVRDIVPNCKDPHWMPQSQRMEAKFWSLIDFVGRIESAATDARYLLERLEAYHRFGTNFTSRNDIFAANSARHSTYSSDQLRRHYTPEIERWVEELYAEDYSHPILNLTRSRIFLEDTSNLSSLEILNHTTKKPN